MRFVTLLAAGLLALTGCATGASNSLADTSWNVTAINGTAPVAGSRPTMTFTGDKVSISTGCNTLNTGYTLSGTAMTFSPNGAMTAMGCLDELGKQESAFTAALAKVTKMSLTGDTLALQDASGASLFTLAKAVPPVAKPLEGTTWQLSGVRNGQATSSVVAGSSVTMQISDGRLSGKACNTFRADVTTSGTTITVGPVASTKMACPSEELTTQEQKVLTLLGAANSYQITGSQLQLSSADGSGLDFTAQ